jgi:hypothetical protein
MDIATGRLNTTVKQLAEKIQFSLLMLSKACQISKFLG